MKKYLMLMRYDHWIKQLFIIPGILIALVIIPGSSASFELCIRVAFGLLSVSLVASSNYVINEWLDAKTDRFHPRKKDRVAVTGTLNPPIVYLLYFGTFGFGVIIGSLVSVHFLYVILLLWVMGILYNVKPFRTKDIAYLDIYTESINNAIRFLAGWFIVTDKYYPPVSIVLGYWFAGAFLMSMKRFAERRMIDSQKIATQYRESFKIYTEQKLMILSFFNAMLSVLFVGIFLIKYRIELIIFMSFYIGLFCYYFHMSCKDDSVAQSPEKLYKDRGMRLYILALLLVFILAMLIDIPLLEQLLSNALIPIVR